jgi:hypothetical protein
LRRHLCGKLHLWRKVMYGRPLVGKSFFGISAKESGAVMYAAFVRGR